MLPARPDGWAAIACTPGTGPFRGLGQALGPALASDPEALSGTGRVRGSGHGLRLLRRWRATHAEALVIVDQFEELFTLNRPDVQAQFASLVGCLVDEADVHVVLSMRDDFLMRCHDHAALAPVFNEITPLGALTPANLARALVEPAKKRGYRFEDDTLVDEMVEAVADARAALPLLAFAVSRLWERRDRETKRLTRAAYERHRRRRGRPGAACRGHAGSLGSRQDLVREVFRNLVTAQGTRAVIDQDELLSAFPDRGRGRSPPRACRCAPATS